MRVVIANAEKNVFSDYQNQKNQRKERRLAMQEKSFATATNANANLFLATTAAVCLFFTDFSP